MKTKGWMMAALLIMMMGCLSACKGKEQKAAEAAQSEYEDMVDACRSKIKKADEPEKLKKVKEKLIDLADYDEMYGRALPEVFCKAKDIQKQYDKKVEKLTEQYTKLADSYIDDNNYFEALQTMTSLYQLGDDDQKLKELLREWAPMMGYIVVNDVRYANCEKDASDIEPEGSTLHSNKMRYLYPKVYYDSMLPEGRPVTEIQLMVKIFNPDGSMKTGTDSPKGYTYGSTIKVAVGEKNNGEWLKGYGNATVSAYPVGTYKVEYYYKGILIYRNEVEIN